MSVHLAMEDLRMAVEQSQQEMRDAIKARDVVIAMAPVADLIVDLVLITQHAPVWHLGHLESDRFELVRDRLGAQVELRVYGPSDCDRYLIIDETRGGCVIKAQMTAPPAATDEQAASPSEQTA